MTNFLQARSPRCFRSALIQICSSRDVERNLAELGAIIRDAATAGAVAQELAASGWTPLKIFADESAPEEAGRSLAHPFGKKVSIDELILFSHQMYSLTRAGISVVRAMRLGRTVTISGREATTMHLRRTCWLLILLAPKCCTLEQFADARVPCIKPRSIFRGKSLCFSIAATRYTSLSWQLTCAVACWLSAS